MNTIYSARRINKRFGGNPALIDVDFDIVEGEVNGLVGTNGAGKSTLLKIVVGALSPDSGELHLDGRRIGMSSVLEAAAAGIAMVSQELSLFPALSIEENLLLAPGREGWNQRRAFAKRGRDVLASLGVEAKLDWPLHRLGLADRQLIEIARALLQNPRVLILDEPTSSLHVAEVERLHRIIRGLRDSGIGIVYVSHFLEELLEISDNLVILRNGRRVPEKITPTPARLGEVIAAMLGDAPTGTRDDDRGYGEVLTEAGGKAATGPLRISGLRGPTGLVIDELNVPPGRVTGLAGLAGAGVEELFAVLFGRSRPKAGEIVLPNGLPLPRSTPAAVKAGVAYAPADRKLHGLMLRQSIAENIVSVRSLTLGRDGILMDASRMTEIAAEQCERLGVVASSPRQLAGELSGGNQQKIVFAKWLEAQPTLLLLDDPTRGIDVAAKREMHRLMHRLARSGLVVMFSSSDPGETAAVADVVLVFVNGRYVGELSGETLNEPMLVAAMNTGIDQIHRKPIQGSGAEAAWR